MQVLDIAEVLVINAPQRRVAVLYRDSCQFPEKLASGIVRYDSTDGITPEVHERVKEAFVAIEAGIPFVYEE